MTLTDAQTQVDDWIKKYGKRYFDELTNLGILTEEVGEVARIMTRNYGEQSYKTKKLAKQADLGDELADVLWVILCIANQTNINLEESFKKTVIKKTKRDNRRHLNNSKLNN